MNLLHEKYLEFFYFRQRNVFSPFDFRITIVPLAFKEPIVNSEPALTIYEIPIFEASWNV